MTHIKKIGAVVTIMAMVVIASLSFYFLKNNNSTNDSVSSCTKKITCADCNLLLISVDSLRVDHMGIGGYERNTTPHFDALATKGSFFSNYITAAYLTPISEMALHTGMYPSGHGMTSFTTVMSEKNKTLAEILKQDGYKTFAAHMSPEFIANVGVEESFNRGFDYYEPLNKNLSETRKISSADVLPGIFDTHTKEGKFFGWITVGNVHWPYRKNSPNVYADPNYQGIFKNKPLALSTFENVYQGLFYPEKLPITEADMQYVGDQYDNGVRQFDAFLGELINDLSARALLDSTIIVIESEHGEELGERGYVHHYDIYNEEIRTPLLIVYPGAKAQTVSTLTSSVDVLPSLLEMLGFRALPQVQGQSMVQSMCGEKEERSQVFSERNPLWEEIAYYDVSEKDRSKDVAIITNEWKYILRGSQKSLEEKSMWHKVSGLPFNMPNEELYNRLTDPHEQYNVASSSPEVVTRLREQVEMWKKQMELISPDTKQVLQIQDYF